jgi:hypothetical protein
MVKWRKINMAWHEEGKWNKQVDQPATDVGVMFTWYKRLISHS